MPDAPPYHPIFAASLPPPFNATLKIVNLTYKIIFNLLRICVLNIGSPQSTHLCCRRIKKSFVVVEDAVRREGVPEGRTEHARSVTIATESQYDRW